MSYYFNRSKYHASKVTTPEGIAFDSKKEAARYYELKVKEEHGEIQNLQRQVVFELLPKQIRNGKCIERAVKYKADFTYKQDGVLVVEDVKGFKTQEYRLKKKLMLFIHNIQIKEV